METYEVLSPGKKIRKIRKSFKINQEDITGGEITRNLISIIENDKANLTFKVASILSQNINKVCKNKGIDFTVTAEYLLENVESQAQHIADRYILDLKSRNFSLQELDKVCNEIECFLAIYEIHSKKNEIYSLLGDLYLNLNDNEKAYLFYIKGYENALISKDKEILTDILLKLSSVFLKCSRFNDVFFCSTVAFSKNKNIDDVSAFQFYINDISALIKCQNPKEALKKIDFAEKSFNKLIMENRTYRLHLMKLKAEAFKKLHYFNDALKVEKKLLFNCDKDDLEDKLLSVASIIEIYSFTMDQKGLRNLLRSNEDIIRKYISKDIIYLSPYILSSLGGAYDFIGDEENALKIFMLSIKSCRTIDDKNIIFEAVKKCFDFLIKSDRRSEMDELKNEMLTLISIDKMPKINELLLKFIKYYEEIHDTETASSLMAFALH